MKRITILLVTLLVLLALSLSTASAAGISKTPRTHKTHPAGSGVPSLSTGYAWGGHRSVSIKLLCLLACVSFIMLTSLTASLAPSNVTHTQAPTTSGNYLLLGTAQGQGGVQSSMVGPGISASNQLFYLDYAYVDGTMDLVAIDSNSGNFHVYPSPVSSEQGAWGLTAGPDNNIYIGTFPGAHLLQFNTVSQRLTDLGRIPPDPGTSIPQLYVWQLTVSPHTHKIYGCTYPSADLFSYDPLDTTPSIVNLGTIDTTGKEQYARTCIADPNPNSPYIYIGLGAVTSSVIAYNTDTQTITPLINSSSASFGWTYLSTDGNTYTYIRGCSPCQYYKLLNGSLSQVNSYPQPAPTNVLQSGGTIAVNANTITVSQPGQQTITYPYNYSRPLPIFRIGLGPSGKVYGDTVLPDYFFSFNPFIPAAGIRMLGLIGSGETYSLLAYSQLLYLASYSLTPLAVYTPSQPFSSTSNPLPNLSGNLPHDLQPVAMIGAANNTIYMGSYGSYGQLTGPLLSWNTLSNAVQETFPIQNQGVASLAATTSPCQGSSASFCLIGGTTINGGGGTTPSTTTAQLFSWDPTTNSLLHTYTLPNVNQPSLITDLMTDPSTGSVYGIATNKDQSYIFVFNPATGQFLNGGIKLPFYSVLYNSVGIYHGSLWGLTAQGIFKINLKNVRQAAIIPSGQPITVGFAMHGHTIYFASNSNLWSYTIS